MKDIIIFDIDGTLSLVGDRKEYLKGPKKDWDSFYKHCGEDQVNEPIGYLFDVLTKVSGGSSVILVTGRRESCRLVTENWIEKHFNFPARAENLLMRSNGDCRHDSIVKPELVAPFINRIQMIFEDRASMVQKWRELGIPCLQVAEGNF